MTIFHNRIHIFTLLTCIISILSSSNAAVNAESTRGPFTRSNVFMTARNVQTKQEARICVNYQQFLKSNIPEKLIARDVESAKPFMLRFWRGMTNATSLCPLPEHDPRSKTVDYQHSLVPVDYRIGNDAHSAGTLCDRPRGDRNIPNVSQFIVDQLRERDVAVALLIVDKGRRHGYVGRDYLWSYFYDPNISDDSIPTFYIYRSDFVEKLMNVSKNIDEEDIEIRFHRPDNASVEISLVFIWLIAMSCVGGGGIWAHFRHRAGKDVPIVRPRPSEAVTDLTQSDPENPGQRAVGGADREEKETDPHFLENYVNAISIFCMMIALTAVLLIGYFFRPFMVTVFNLTLVFFGTASIYGLLRGISSYYLGDKKWYTARMTWAPSVLCISKKYQYSAAFMMLCAFAFCVTWYWYRLSPDAYLMLNTINVAICLHVLKCLRLPSLKWITILMCCMFFYDAFMVFGTQYITPNGCSIMVEVATGSGACSRSTESKSTGHEREFVAPVELTDRPEKFPMLMQMRHFSAMDECLDMEVEVGYQTTILGLGDIIMPGYLTAHCFTMSGFSNRARQIYGIVSIVGYGVGLIATFLAMSVAQVAQPALIYLVPFTVLPIMAVAVMRKEFRQIWIGAPPDAQLLIGRSSPDSLSTPMEDVPQDVTVTDSGSFSNPLDSSKSEEDI